MFRSLFAFLLLCAALSGQVLRITAGVVDDQILQRDSDGKADIAIAGIASGADTRAIEARLIHRGVPREGFEWRTLATVEQGRWSGKLSGVPAGGPYRIEVRIAGTQATERVAGVLIGDLWLLAGQSDMEGRGYLTEAIAPHPMVHSFDMRDHWLVAEEPLHTRIDALDRVYWFPNEKNIPEPWRGEKLYRYLRERDRGTGLGLPFAIEMFRRTGIPVGLVPCALGGTSMDQWSPALKDKGGDSLYGATLRRARAAGGRFRGVLWSQGQGDATQELMGSFHDKFKTLISSLREDLGQPDLPFYFVQIGRLVTTDKIGDPWNVIQEVQRQVELEVPHTGMVATVDESLVDLAHADATSLKRLGVRLAKLACRDLFPDNAECAKFERGPRPVSANYVQDTPTSDLKYYEKAVRVTFASVNGRLRAAGRLSGFTIHEASGGALPLIYGIDVDSTDGRSVLIRLTDKPPAGAVLRYGYGIDPYCNVEDEAGLPVPAFGPMEIRQ